MHVHLRLSLLLLLRALLEPLRQWSGRARVDDHTLIVFRNRTESKAREASSFPGFLFFMPDLLPLFLNLRGRTVLLVGGGPVAAAKLTQLLAVGARVRVVAPAISTEIADQLAIPNAGPVSSRSPSGVSNRPTSTACGSSSRRRRPTSIARSPRRRGAPHLRQRRRRPGQRHRVPERRRPARRRDGGDFDERRARRR